jgi:hypothetical protein
MMVEGGLEVSTNHRVCKRSDSYFRSSVTEAEEAIFVYGFDSIQDDRFSKASFCERKAASKTVLILLSV